MNTERFRIVALAFSVAVILACDLGSSALGATQHSQAKPILETIEWTDIWVTNANRNDLPRVLFVGDSITRGYFKSAEKQLGGQANCARYTTSAFIAHQGFLDGLKIVLDRYDFAVIHINNGLHGWDYTEEEYRNGFPPLIKLLKEHAPGATLIWAMTTPIRQRGSSGKLKEESTGRVRQRNQIAAEFVKRNHFETSALFSLVVDHPEYFGSGGVHFNAKGIGVQGKYVAGVVRQALKSRASEAAASAAQVD